MKAFRPILFLAAVLLVVGLACSALSGGISPTQPVETAVQVEPTASNPPTTAPEPTTVPPTEVATEAPTATEEVWTLDLQRGALPAAGRAAGQESRIRFATAFEQIYLQPSGDVGLTGIMLETPFVKGTLSKLGMSFRGDHRYEYKNALNTLTETKYTPAHKEAMTALMNSWFGQMRDGICQARQIPADQFATLVDRGPYLGKEAVDAKLVDGLAYRDEVYEKVREKVGKGAELLYLDKYLDRAGRPHEKGKTIALVYGAGGLVAPFVGIKLIDLLLVAAGWA